MLKEIKEKFLTNDPNHLFLGKNILTAYKKVCDGKAAFLAPPIRHFFPDAPCDLVRIDPGYFASGVAIPLKKGFSFVKQFRLA